MAVLCHIMYIPLVPIPHARQGLEFSLRKASEVHVRLHVIFAHAVLPVQSSNGDRCIDGHASGSTSRAAAELIRKMIAGGMTECVFSELCFSPS